MELIFVDRKRTTAVDHQKLAKDTCIQLLKMIHVHRSGQNGTETIGTRTMILGMEIMGVIRRILLHSAKKNHTLRGGQTPLPCGGAGPQYGFNM